MSEIANPTTTKLSPFLLLLFFASLSLHFFPGFSGDPSTSKDGKKADARAFNGSTGTRIIIICVSLFAFVLLSVFLFKLWQKKKREEQYARLLKLFEEDDELELELGLRD